MKTCPKCGHEPGVDGEALRRLRLERNLTLKHVAQAAGVSQGYVSQVESGTRAAPSLLEAFAAALGVPPEFLERRPPEWAASSSGPARRPDPVEVRRLRARGEAWSTVATILGCTAEEAIVAASEGQKREEG